MHLFIVSLFYELRLAIRSGSDFISVLFFFITIMCISSFLLKSVLWIGFELGVTISWIACLSSYLISLEKYYSRNLEDGTLEFYYSNSNQVALVLFTKSISHWITHGIPMSIFSAILFIFYDVNYAVYPILSVSFFFSTLIFSFIGFLGYSLTYRLKYRSSLLSVIVLPLYFPIILISLIQVDSYLSNFDILHVLKIYSSLTLVISILSVKAIYYALKYSLD